MDPLLLLVMIYGTAVVGLLETQQEHRRMPWLTVAMCALVAAGLLLQLANPLALPVLERDGGAIADGEWWRILTALFVQDGWVVGGVSNLVSLLCVGAVAEQHLSRKVWIGIYLIGGIASELLALLWQPFGAGNSIACCALGSSLLLLTRPVEMRLVSRVLAGLTVCAAIALIFRRDIHGAAFVVGLALGACVRTGRMGRYWS